jgi:hypothetical protein
MNTLIDKAIAEASGDSIHAVIGALKLLLSGGIGAAFVGLLGKLWLDRKLERQRAGYDKELENLKAELAQKHTIHKLQFEKEFAIYDALWAEIVQLKNLCAEAIHTENADGKLMRDGKVLEGDRLKPFIEKCKSVVALVESKAPFYAEDVSGKAQKLARIAGSLPTNLVVKHTRASQGQSVSYIDDFETLRRMMPIIDEIEKSIRNRIGTMREAEVIE